MSTRRVIFPPPDYWTRNTPKEHPMNIPTDVVARRPPTREELLRMNDASGSVMTISEPGDVTTDQDGLPIGVGPTTTYTAPVAGAVVHRHWLTAAGLTEDDVPNLTVIDRKGLTR